MISPGDKVSFINEKLSGVVKRVIDKKQVLLLLDDGFEFPANISELIVTESAARKQEEKIIEDLSILADEEDTTGKLFFGTVSEDTGKGILVKAYLINTKAETVHFVLYNASFGDNKGLAQGILEPSRAIRLFEFDLSRYEQYRNFVFQAISYAETTENIAAPLNTAFRIRQVNLIKDQKLIPVLRKPGYQLSLDDIQEKQFREPDKVQNTPKPEPVPDIIDLHLEELTDRPKDMMPHAALELQLRVFNNSLEKAIAQEKKNITFIHGVGQGRLKQEILKVLNLNPFIQGFEDADHKKFGYGATIVYLKNR